MKNFQWHRSVAMFTGFIRVIDQMGILFVFSLIKCVRCIYFLSLCTEGNVVVFENTCLGIHTCRYCVRKLPLLFPWNVSLVWTEEIQGLDTRIRKNIHNKCLPSEGNKTLGAFLPNLAKLRRTIFPLHIYCFTW